MPNLAQLNIALPREPLESELLAPFVAELDAVNARAEAAPGFVWRMTTEDGDNTAATGFGDDRLIINMSVWRSLEDLRAFVYRDPEHLAVMRRRREWFERMDLFQVLWWVPDGHFPDIAEAEERLDLLRDLGPSPDAFTWREPFGAAAAPDACPA